MNERVGRVATRLGLSSEEARARTLQEDAARREYLRRNYAVDIAEERHYDLIIKSGRVGMEEAVEALASLVRAGSREEGA